MRLGLLADTREEFENNDPTPERTPTPPAKASSGEKLSR